MNNTRVKIPDQFYVGFVKSNDGLPVGYLTPFGKDVASKRRISTVKSHSKGEMGIPDGILSNLPACGFRIIKSQDGGYNTGKVVWRVEDPRGFQSEIMSGNMSELIGLTTIDRGEILESCVWARDGKDNVLLPVNSQEYANAMLNTKLAKSIVHIRDVKIGNRCNLKNGIKDVIYLGKYYHLTGFNSGWGWRYSHGNGKTAELVDSGKLYYMQERKNADGDASYTILSYGSNQVAEIIDNSVMSHTDAERKLNDINKGIYFNHKPEIGVDLSINLIKQDIKQLAIQHNQSTVDFMLIVADNKVNELAICDYAYFGNRFGRTTNELTFFKVLRTDFLNGIITPLKTVKSESSNSGFYGRTGRTYEEIRTLTVDVTNIDSTHEFYFVEISWKNQNGEFRKLIES